MLIKFIILSYIFGVVLSKLDKNANSDEFYIAGVVEYGNKDLQVENNEISPERYLADNLLEYLNFISKAEQQNVDILLFPEATLNYFPGRQKSIKYAIELPNPDDKIAPFEHPDRYSEVLRKISKQCKDNQIYVLVNLIEKVPCVRGKQDRVLDTCKRNDNFNLYNTNVVFDRHGRVISKYQKFHLFMEAEMETPRFQQYATFTTDFNVRFGHFICFDIMFEEPAASLIHKENITNFLFPSMWYSDLPFLTSIQTHSNWAYAHNVNMLSGGASNPIRGSSGSGIFQGRNFLKPNFISSRNMNQLITATIRKDPRSNVNNNKQPKKVASLQPQPKFTALEMSSLKITEDWSKIGILSWEIDTNLNEPQKICVYNEICCVFEIKMKQLSVPAGKTAYRYRLVANSTIRNYGDENIGGEMYCAILSCTNQYPESCGRRFKNYNSFYPGAVEFESIKITANVRNSPEFGNSLIMPTTLDTTVRPLETNEFEFRKIGSSNEFIQYKMESKDKLKDILTFGIFGRSFTRDRNVKARSRL